MKDGQKEPKKKKLRATNEKIKSMGFFSKQLAQTKTR